MAEMKNKYIFVPVLLAVLAISSYLISVMGTHIEKDSDELLVVTSFYPVYIATLNVTDGVDGVQVECLTQSATGCVHDVQLTTQDMRLLEKADVFIINGAGMEMYLDSITERYPDLKVIDTSVGTQLLEASGEHHHEGETDVHEEEHEEEHDHEHNAHIWLNIDNYCIQVENIEQTLVKLDEKHSLVYEDNQNRYEQKLRELQAELRGIGGDEHIDIVSTHEGFSYFAQNLDWHVAGTINMDENTSLQASSLSEIIECVEEERVPYVFTEEMHGVRLSDILKQETGCETVMLDVLVSGEEDKDAYLNGMKENIEILREVTAQ